MDPIRCVLHGSLNRNFGLIKKIYALFSSVGIDVLAPKMSQIVSIDRGFVAMEEDVSLDRRIVELDFISKSLQLRPGRDFSYFVNPDGRLGVSASFELGYELGKGINQYFIKAPKDPPIYAPAGSIRSPQEIADFVYSTGSIPQISKGFESYESPEFQRLHNAVLAPSVYVAVGAIIEAPTKNPKTGLCDIFMVSTHRWNGVSIVGTNVGAGESFIDALERGVHTETKLAGEPGYVVYTGEEEPGFFLPRPRRNFIDYIFRAHNRSFRLDHQAEEGFWIQPHDALSGLVLESNARHSLVAYWKMLVVANPEISRFQTFEI